MKNLKNLKLYTSIVLSGMVLAGTLSACKEPQTVKPNPIKVEPTKMEQLYEPKELDNSISMVEDTIEQVPCLVFSSPVDAITIVKTDEQVSIGRDLPDRTPIYASKYAQLEEVTTRVILTDELIICMDVWGEDGKLETKQFSAYRDLSTGSLVIFPNGVVEQQIVGNDTVAYEYNGKIIEQEIPIYKSVLSFTTGQEVTESLLDVDFKDPEHPILSSYLEAYERGDITR